MHRQSLFRLGPLLLIATQFAACGGDSGGLRLPDAATYAALSVPTQLIQIKAAAGTPQNTTNVRLEWNPVRGAAAYTLYRCEVPAGLTSSAQIIAAAPAEGCGSPIAVTTAPAYIDVPPLKAPTAYVYHVRACVDMEGKVCGPVIGSAVASQAIPAPVTQMTTIIGDDGRQVIAGLRTTLHAVPDGATGNVSWSWVQESGPRVTLIGADTPDLAFVAPDVSVNTLLGFELRTIDSNGPGRPSKVAVTVVPAANVSVTVGHATRLAQTGHVVSLHADGSAPGLQYRWRQLSPASPVVALTGADTDNVSFVAPILQAGGRLLFEVTATDPVSSRNASALAAVDVQYPAPNPVPNPVPGQVPQPIPIAAPLLAPLLFAQPLLVPQPNVAVPLPSPVAVAPKVPPQALVLVAPPAIVATGDTLVQVAMVANGGTAPYQWSWSQTGGPAAVLSNNTQPVLSVQLPVVSATESLTFEAVLTDAVGTRRTAQAVVRATLPPQPPVVGDPARAPDLVQAPRLITVNEAAPVFGTPWTEVTVVQQDGPQLSISQQVAGAGTVVVVTAPLLKDNSATATLRVTGKDSTGRVQGAIVPLILMRPPGLAPALAAPPQVPVLNPSMAPKQDDPLLILGSRQGTVDEGRQGVSLALFARGGKGTPNYSFRWDYLKEAGGPDLVPSTSTAPGLTLNVPLVDRPTTLRFLFQVTDGVQVAQTTYLLNINDLAPTENVGSLAPITVASGHAVTISMPAPIGGLPFAPPAAKYQYSIAQTSGPALPLPPLQTIAGPGNWGFNAPVLAAGAADQVLVFELTATDRSGSAVRLTQQVTVTAPQVPAGPPLAVSLSVPPNLTYAGASVAFQLAGTATGGVAPYAYAWTVRPDAQAIAGKPAFNLPDLSATGSNPSVTVDLQAPRRLDIASYRLQTTLRVTDAAGSVATAAGVTDVVIVELTRPGTEALLCGDETTGRPCTDLDLVLAMTSTCPASEPYALNTIIQTGDRVQEYRRCVDAIVAYQKFVLGGSKDNPQCRNFDASNTTGSLTCYLACYGDGCNIDTNPPDNTLIGPPGPDGLLTVGIPPLP